MSLNFKKIQILSDFNLNLEMFNLSKKIQKNLSKLLNINIIFQFVNFNRPNQKYNAEIYWGTRPNNTLIKKIYGLKWIHMGSVGVDKLDIQMLKKKYISYQLIRNKHRSDGKFNNFIFNRHIKKTTFF